MAELKTKPTGTSIKEFVDNIEDETRKSDSKRLLKLMEKATGTKPRVWGSMVGFGDYHYKYASGREGDHFRVGFAPRKQSLTLYFTSGFDGFEDLLAKLGTYTTGKGCLYIKHLDGVDEGVLREMIERTWSSGK